MPSSSLADYLAKNYLTADPATERPKKKRKKTKEVDTAVQGLIIADDDPPDLKSSAANFANDDEDGPSVVTSGRSAEFRRTKKSNWKNIGGAGNEQDAADAIIASAAAENAARRNEGEDDDAPAVVGDGCYGAAQERRKKVEAALYKDSQAGGQAQETIYRDASGRIINVAMKRAEARKAEQEKLEKEEQAKEALMGDVQRQEREKRRQQLQEARAMPLARTVDDEDMNDELRARERWNDPAAQFLTNKSAGKSATGKPLYKGAFQPNRYGIRPGHRWDGVDRSNGFEKEWFAARNRKGRLEALDYQWQMDE
ncbi:pre-mRNA-splicing factor cwc26 [Aspergillus arachidicola]|uniref:Pre-mRNA-splicing factor cwc26 n=1 Tax=Aspergillus arachidicola TaxID=656916 RepID=A0A2G7FR45_9EURO|nr:pre-mRNA-splicing factor cwc26 [Aspergillus arachidicola]